MTRRYTGGFLSSKEQVTDVNSANGVYTTQEAGALTATGSFPTGRWTPQRSLRARSLAGSFLTRPGAAGNRTTWTYSVWFKRGDLTTGDQAIISANTDGSNRLFFYFQPSGYLSFYHNIAGTAYELATAYCFRDPSAWYHIVISVDTTQSVASNRLKFYVNGVQQTLTATTGSGWVPQNTATQWNHTVPQYIGKKDTSSIFTDAYWSEINNIDGLQLDPSYFGQTDPETGSWVPKLYTGSYGTNGFYLPFSDNTGLYPLTADRSSGSYAQTIGQGTANGYYISSATATYQAVSTVFDGLIGSSYGNCFGIAWTGAISVAAGKDWGAGQTKTITAFRVTGSTIDGVGFNSGTIATTVKLQGSPDNSTWTDLYTNASVAAGTPQLTVTSGITTTTAYRYHRVSITENSSYGGSHVVVIGELEFFEAGTGGLNCFFNSATSLTAGVTYDSMVDVPGIAAVSAQNDVGGVQRGNYATLNPLHNPAGVTLLDGNLKTTVITAHSTVNSTIGVTSGKWYFEMPIIARTDTCGLGITTVQTPFTGYPSNFAGGWWAYHNAGGLNLNTQTAGTGYGSVMTAGQVWHIALDMDKGIAWVGYNGSWYSAAASAVLGSGNPATGANPTWNDIPVGKDPVFFFIQNVNCTLGANFGQRPFSYTPPTGFKSLNTANLPNPIIKRSSDHFDVKTYIGNGTSLTVGTTAKQTSAIAINRALKLNSSITQALTRTQPVSGSRTTWTWSGWIKRGVTNTQQGLFSTGAGGTDSSGIIFNSSGQLYFYDYVSSAFTSGLISNQKFIDNNAWYHIVVTYDTTQSAVSNRIRMYVNGVQITSFNTATYPSQNYASGYINSNIYNTFIGKENLYGNPYDGYMAETNFIDGQALTPSSFGQFDANNNWMPKRYTSTYGTNGFYLPFDPPTTPDTAYYGASFNGTSQYLSLTANSSLQFGTGNFTVEGWYYQNGSVTYGNIFSTTALFGTTGGLRLSTGASGTNTFQLATGGSALFNASTSFPLNQWIHFAVVRNSGTTTLYVNGVASGSASDSNSYTADTFLIGWVGGSGGSAYLLNGILSNLRVVKGTAIYTSNFVPPTTQLTAVSGTSLLTLQNATLIDNSTNAFSITNNGTISASPTTVFNKSVGNDSSGNNNHYYSLYTSSAFNFVPDSSRAPNVLYYGNPGTYTWTAPAGVTSVDYLVVAGGGGGGTQGGGGGAGGMLTGTLSVTPNISYTVTVGVGGVGSGGASGLGSNGSNSVFSSITATGGGGGGGRFNTSGAAGGSGGGGAYGSSGGAGTSGQGNTGGGSASGANEVGGGGGGAGAVGLTGSGSSSGNGGCGLAARTSGVAVYYAAGGGGGGYTGTGSITPGIGGLGGGGAGGTSTGSGASGSAGTDGILGFGGGGGGGGAKSGLSYNGGNGGSGVVILSYTNAGSYVGNGAGSSNNNSSVLDIPVDVVDSLGNSAGNYCVIDPSYSGTVVQNAGLTSVGNSANSISFGTLGVSTGKWYYETTVVTYGYPVMKVGLANKTATGELGDTTTGWGFITQNNGNAGQGVHSGSVSSTYTSIAAGDILMFAWDCDAGKMWVGKNGTWLNSGVPTSGTGFIYGDLSGTIFPAYSNYNKGGSPTGIYNFNFGQSPFVYTPPTGFKTLNTKNLKDVGSYNLPDTWGNFVNTPDLVWIKGRSSAYEHEIFDTVRGPANYLSSNSTAANSNNWATLTSFKPNGFDVGAGGYNNAAGATYVGWSWNRGQTPGFDIVNYAGNGTAQSIPHNLNNVPKMMFVKQLTGVVRNWFVYHGSLAPTQCFEGLNTTSAVSTQAAWNNTSPTPTSFSVGANNGVNNSGDSYIAYLWAEVPGFSKFGSYTGNGAADGPFIYLGFKPKWIMIKRIDSTGNWDIQDTARGTYNPTTGRILAESTSAELFNLSSVLDINSNGFKIRNTDTSFNASGGTYIYTAYAETPFKYGNAR
jgi:hypothetical protein